MIRFIFCGIFLIPFIMANAQQYSRITSQPIKSLKRLSIYSIPAGNKDMDTSGRQPIAVYSFDLKGFKTNQWVASDDEKGIETQYTYDPDGNIIEEKIKDEKNATVIKYSYTYMVEDESKLIVIDKYEDGKLIELKKKAYTENGDYTISIIENEKSVFQEYYDKNGLKKWEYDVKLKMKREFIYDSLLNISAIRNLTYHKTAKAPTPVPLESKILFKNTYNGRFLTRSESQALTEDIHYDENKRIDRLTLTWPNHEKVIYIAEYEMY